MKLKHIYLSALMGVAASGLFLTGCADDLGVKAPDTEAPNGIVLRIPNLDAAAEFASSRAEGVNDDQASEGTINNLYLYIFKKGNDGNYTRAKAAQDIAGTNSSVNSTSYTPYNDYKLSLEPGTYKFYLLANFKDYGLTEDQLLALNSIDGIEGLTLKFENGLLTNGNLPMICKSAVGTSESGSKINGSEIEISGNETSKIIYADLSFLCSKLRYTVLFDNTTDTSISKDFGSKVVDFNNPSIANILTETPITGTSTKTDGAKNGAITLEKFAYPTESNYPSETSPNLSVSSSNANKLAWQGIVYLPENLSSSKSTITLTGACYKSASEMTATDKVYDLPSKVTTLCPDNVNNGKFERASMYDVVIKVKNYDALDVAVTCAPWETTDILADFVHTYLTLDKTTAEVTSLEETNINNVIKYTTDGRGGVKFECSKNDVDDNLRWNNETVVDAENNPIIKAEINDTKKEIILSANPDVLITELQKIGGKIEGEAICWIIAGNIKKQIKVEYNLTPYLTVTPQTQKIRYQSGSAELTKTFEYSTNLGGIVLKGREKENDAETIYLSGNTTSSEKSVGSSTLSISCDDPSAGKGTITVTETGTPTESADHLFTVYSVNGNLSKDISVEVVPISANYIIYFRAINDYQDPNGGEFLNGMYSNWNNEGPNNWLDWWADDGNKEKNNVEHHLIYIYGQNGETIVNGQNGEAYWEFNNFRYDGDNNEDIKQEEKMKASGSYPGWFYYELDSKAHPMADEYKSYVPEPGKTLLIFYAHRAQGSGIEKHRAPHHNDAGVTLFDYEDQEGYILYDPTRSPYTTTYDSRPVIQDVTYTVYSKDDLTSWYNRYGNADGNKTSYDADHPQWTIEYKFKDSDWTQSGDWKKYQFKLKAPAGDYAKAIKVRRENKNGKCRIYFKVRKNDNNWTDVDSTPYIYYSDGSDSDKRMTFEREENDGWIYRYDMPFAYKDYGVLFKSNNKKMETDWITFDYYKGIIYTSQNEWQKHSSYLSDKDYQCDYYNESPVLFNGEIYPNNTGYWNGSKWSQTPN